MWAMGNQRQISEQEIETKGIIFLMSLLSRGHGCCAESAVYTTIICAVPRVVGDCVYCSKNVQPSHLLCVFCYADQAF